MGRIKTTMVKRATRQLIQQEHEFTEDFEHNKKLIKDLMPSKHVRNKIAGYITRLLKQEKKAKTEQSE